MNWRERTLLVLAIVGFVVPNTLVALFAARHGFTFDGYFRLGRVAAGNPARPR